jgi:hypothetical protein
MSGAMADFGSVLRTVFRFVRYLGYVSIVLLGLWIADRLVALYGLGARVHWTLGVLAVLAALAALAFFVGRPAWRFLRVPAAVTPPPLPDPAERTPRDLVRHLRFLDRYVEALGRNPHWSGKPEEIASARAAIETMRRESDAAEPNALASLEPRIAALERETVGALLAPLDRKASDAIRGEAMGVGIATAISPNGTLDAFVVLWRAVNLVSRLATIYYGRPGARGTLRIVGEVSTATLVSAYSQDLTEMAGGMIGSLGGKAAGAVAGPLLDGTLNAIGTLRVGYIAKARCRSFSAWTPKTRVEAVRAAVGESARLARGLVGDLVTHVGGGILRLPFRLLGTVTSAFLSYFRKPEPDAGEA